MLQIHLHIKDVALTMEEYVVVSVVMASLYQRNVRRITQSVTIINNLGIYLEEDFLFNPHS